LGGTFRRSELSEALRQLLEVEAASPVNKTLEVARNAARDGHPTEVIVNILTNDPGATVW